MTRTIHALGVALALAGTLLTVPAASAAAAAAATTTTTATTTATTTTLTSATIDAYLDRAMAATGLPGMSVVVTHGATITHAAGYGHDSAGDPITAHTPMRVASLSKSFTAMAVMTLVDAGRIALDEPVAEQLPEFRMADPRAGRITVRHLLNQTSGLSDTTVDIGATRSADTLADYVAEVSAGTLATDPGTRWEYCNVNYNLAARLVEVVSGRSFGDYLREHVLDPLGMTDSAVSAQVVRPADGYNSLFGAWVSRPERPGFLDGGGSGGVVTTAADLGRWLVSQTGHGPQVVSPESLAAMHAPSPVQDYGMGWGEQTVGDTPLLTHGGNLFTYSAVQAIDPATGYGFAVLTNSAALYDATVDVLDGLVALSQGEAPETPGGTRQLVELVLGLLALAAVGLGVLGVLRSRRWASRRVGGSAWRTGLRLVPVLLPALLLAGYPALVSFLMNGRTVTWTELTYFPAPLTITIVVAAVAGTVTAVFRLLRLRSVLSSR